MSRRAVAWSWALLMAALVVLGEAHQAGAATTVMRQGFCLARSESGCAEVVLPGTSVDYRRLPKDQTGAPVILYFSAQQAKAGSVFAHVLEAEDADPAVELGVIEGGGTLNIGRALEKLSAKMRGVGHVVITMFRADSPRADSQIVYSFLRVTGPGVFHGRVVDVDGVPARGSDLITFNIVRQP